MLVAFAWLVIFQVAGEVTIRLFTLPLPGPVVGLVLLYAALVIRGGVPEALQATSRSLLGHLMLFVVPATAGLMLQFERLRQEWLPIMLAGVGGTAVTMAVTAVTLRLFVGKDRRR